MRHILTLDFETYFSKDYSLRFMTTREYIMDPRFEVIGASMALDREPARWVDGSQLAAEFEKVDWSNTALLAHNTMFDGAILNWRFGHAPAFYFDTMGMAQALLVPTTGSAALKTLSRFVGREKKSESLMKMEGRRLRDMDTSSQEWRDYVAYANEDVETCRDLFKFLGKSFPASELRVIDLLLRMYIHGTLQLDKDVLDEAIAHEIAEEKRLLAAAGVPDASVLRSSEQFANLLRARGVEPPTKISPTTGKTTYAFAKTDLMFTALLDHSDPAVAALVEAKLNASSSIARTRAERFRAIANTGPILNVPLRYSAAHTHRFGGSDRLNLQNLPRSSALRRAIVAPEGHKIVVVDASQIEARMLAWYAGCTALTSAFAAGEDVYSTFATDVFGRVVNKKDHPNERFVGKTGILGLGYMTGWKKLQWALLTSPFYHGEASDEFCQRIVKTYRTKYPEIPRLWSMLDDMIRVMAEGGAMDYGPVRFRNRHLLLPSGLPVQYPQLHYREGEDWKSSGFQYYSQRYKSWKSLYGGALTENIIQALARIVITDAALAMADIDPDYKLALQVHDELVYVVPDNKAETCYNHLMECMTRTPAWADSSLPLAAEGAIVDRYSDAK